MEYDQLYYSFFSAWQLNKTLKSCKKSLPGRTLAMPVLVFLHANLRVRIRLLLFYRYQCEWSIPKILRRLGINSTTKFFSKSSWKINKSKKEFFVWCCQSVEQSTWENFKFQISNYLFQILKLHMVLFKLEMIQAINKLFYTEKK